MSAAPRFGRRWAVGPTDEGRSSYRIAISICQRCGQVRRQVGGGDVPVDPAMGEMACCDGQHIGGPPREEFT